MTKNKSAKGNFLNIFCLVTIIISLVLVVFLKRDYFITSYNVSYWQDRIEHSQWVLPLSKRAIGDDGLYAYVGYQLVHGVTPAGLNTEIPPVAKYLIGLSIVIFKSTSYYAFLLGVGSIFLFYLLAGNFFKKETSLLLTAALLLNPLFLSQMWPAWLDIAQLFFLLLNLVLLFKYAKDKKGSLPMLVASGIALGLFAETKPPILLPVILLLELWYFVVNKRIKELAIFIVSFIFAVFGSYTRFFELGNSLTSFIKLQKYILSFYLKSQLKTHFAAIWDVLLLGKFPDITGSKFSNVTEWTIILPVVTFVGLVSSIIYLVEEKVYVNKIPSVFLILGLIVFSLIPAYPRYLLILLPFLYLFAGIILDKYINMVLPRIVAIIFLILSIVYAGYYLLPSAKDTLNTFSYSYSNQFFQDIYFENLSHKNLNESMSKFNIQATKVFEDAQIKNINVVSSGFNISKFASVGSVNLVISYKTLNLGQFKEIKTVNFVKENGEWKIVWNPNLLLHNYKPGYSVETDLQLGKRGSISQKGQILVQDANGYLLSVNPSKMDQQKEDQLDSFIGGLAGLATVSIQNAYNENVISNTYVPIATTFYSMTDKQIAAAGSFSGLKLIPYPARIYRSIDAGSIDNTFYKECCTRIYSSHNYHGIMGTEKKYDSILSGEDGGTLVIKDKLGNVVRTIIDKKTKNGQNIDLEDTSL